MRFIIDRIEGKYAVCEQEDLKTIDIPLADLPDGVHEGNILEYNNGIYKIDTVAEAARRERIQALKNSIFNE